MRQAHGEIVAYIDDDAYPDPCWLTYLALTFAEGNYVGVGGPNVQPAGDNDVAECVANAPGGPSHVLFSDLVAEHLPGCNMAFRRDALMAIEGFDTQFRIAGDDVDLCWRLQDQGGVLAYSPCALVWHHRRHSVRDYLRQQRNYGRAEGMLEQKWPARYNRFGHMRWAGRLYGRGHTPLARTAQRVDHGVWGSRLFQTLYTDDPGLLWTLTQMPEWYLVVAMLAALTILAIWWTPLAFAVPLLVFAIGVLAVAGGAGSSKHSVYLPCPGDAAVQTARPHGFAPRAPTAGAPHRPPANAPHPVAPARTCKPSRAADPALRALERDVARQHRLAGIHGGRPAPASSARAPRRQLRPLGSTGRLRIAGWRAAVDHRRRAR